VGIEVTPPAALARPPIRARQRANRIIHEPRLMVLLLAGGIMAAVVVFAVGFSSALYTVSSSEGGSTVGAGAIRLTLAPTGEIIDGAGLKPGATRTGSVTVTNAEQKAEVSLAVANLADTPSGAPSLADVLYVKVTETSPGNALLFNAKLRALASSPLALGTWPAGQQRSYRIQVDWPLTQDSLTYASVKTTFAFDWKAVSLP
jgi:hypothetical protein